MTTTPNFRALCAELLAAIQLYTGQNPAASEMSSVEKTEKLMDAMAATVAALATPPPEPPVDGEVAELAALIRQCALAWEPDARLLGNMTAAQLARAAELLERTATPPPAPPTDEERLADFTKWLAREMPPNTIIGDPLWWAPRIWRAVLKRWGQP